MGEILPIVVLVAVWPLTFLVRKPSAQKWIVAVLVALGLLFLAYAVADPEQVYINLLFGLVALGGAWQTARRNRAAVDSG